MLFWFPGRYKPPPMSKDSSKVCGKTDTGSTQYMVARPGEGSWMSNFEKSNVGGSNRLRTAGLLQVAPLALSAALSPAVIHTLDFFRQSACASAVRWPLAGILSDPFRFESLSLIPSRLSKVSKTPMNHPQPHTTAHVHPHFMRPVSADAFCPTPRSGMRGYDDERNSSAQEGGRGKRRWCGK